MPIKVDVRTSCPLFDCSCCSRHHDTLYEFTFIDENLEDESLFLCPKCVEALHAAFHSIAGKEMD